MDAEGTEALTMNFVDENCDWCKVDAAHYPHLLETIIGVEHVKTHKSTTTRVSITPPCFFHDGFYLAARMTLAVHHSACKTAYFYLLGVKGPQLAHT